MKNPIRWMDSVKEDLKRSGVNNSKNKSANRMEWRSDCGGQGSNQAVVTI